VVGRVLASSRWLRERAFRDLVADEMLPRSRPAGRALDVGCGNGRLMEKLALVGWEVEGSEVDGRAAERTRRRTGLPVHGSGAEDLDPALGPYDLITLSHVFEHLRDPAAALVHLGRLLAPQGRLVLFYPNPESLLARFYGSDWFPWEAPRHLVLPPPPALPGLARRCGLVVASVRTTARSAAAFSAYSRALRRGEPADFGDEARSFGDRALACVERLAVSVGSPVGEEVLVSFRRDR
jgi:SAM-dependent methyltransferase